MRIIFLITLSLITASCGNKKFKEKVGLATKGPNEYEVTTTKPLEVPPHYHLPNPYNTKQITNKELIQNQNEAVISDSEKALIKDLSR